MLETYTDKDKKETRGGFGSGLVEVARTNKNVVGLSADLAGSLRMDAFIKEFPEESIFEYILLNLVLPDKVHK